MSSKLQNKGMAKTLGTWQVMVAGVALVVAASTLVSDFNGFFALGPGFVVALIIAFIINLLLGLSVADLSVAYPKSGAIYDYARAILQGRAGHFAGVFLGLTFIGMFILTLAGETTAGAFGLQALSYTDWDIRIFIVIMSLAALVPNILGIRTAAWVSAGLLLLMLGIRWFFGLSGFFGWSNAGEWQWSNFTGAGFPAWFGENGIITTGLALGIWSFVGIEFACSLAEEVKNPSKDIPRGVLLGLLVIFATSLVMGVGVSGTAPLEIWKNAIAGESGQGGDAPQLAVGQMMFGQTGYVLMALSSVAATLGSLVVAFAAIPRLLFSIARDGAFFGSLSKPFARLHPRFGTPVTAALFTCVMSLIPAFYSANVIDWIFSAAYIWIVLYALFHVLAIVNRRRYPSAAKAFKGAWFSAVSIAGLIATLFGLYFSFAGAHVFYGGRALVVISAALVITIVSLWLANRQPKTRRALHFEISESEVTNQLFGTPEYRTATAEVRRSAKQRKFGR